MNHSVIVLKGIHSYDKSAYYEAFCNRCHEQVRGQDRLANRVWATKSVAVKHAQAHAQMHADADARNWLPKWDNTIVATIPVNCGKDVNA